MIISIEILKLGFFSGSERKNNERGTRIDHISEITNLLIITTNLVTSNKIVSNLKGLT